MNLFQFTCFYGFINLYTVQYLFGFPKTEQVSKIKCLVSYHCFEHFYYNYIFTTYFILRIYFCITFELKTYEAFKIQKDKYKVPL